MITLTRTLALLLAIHSATVWGATLAPDQPDQPAPTSQPAQPTRPDRFLGRWVLDPAASTYPPNTCPKQMIIEMTQEARGVHYHSDTTPQQGTPFQADYTAAYDGKPALVTGTRGILLPVSLTRENDNSVIATYSNGFTVSAMSRRTLSPDGKTLTITTTSTDKAGRSITNTGIYRRTDPPSGPASDPSRKSAPKP